MSLGQWALCYFVVALLSALFFGKVAILLIGAQGALRFSVFATSLCLGLCWPIYWPLFFIVRELFRQAERAQVQAKAAQAQVEKPPPCTCPACRADCALCRRTSDDKTRGPMHEVLLTPKTPPWRDGLDGKTLFVCESCIEDYLRCVIQENLDAMDVEEAFEESKQA